MSVELTSIEPPRGTYIELPTQRRVTGRTSLHPLHNIEGPEDIVGSLRQEIIEIGITFPPEFSDARRPDLRQVQLSEVAANAPGMAKQQRDHPMQENPQLEEYLNRMRRAGQRALKVLTLKNLALNGYRVLSPRQHRHEFGDALRPGRLIPNTTMPTAVIRFSGNGNGGPSPVSWTFVNEREDHVLRPTGALELHGELDIRRDLREQAIDGLSHVCIHPTDDLLRRARLDDEQQQFVIDHPGYFLVE